MALLDQFFLAQQGPQSIISLMFPFVLIIVIFYVMVFLPMRKRQNKVNDMINNLKTGDRVITTGGIYGTVDRIKDQTILLKVADQVKIEVAKNAVAGLQSAAEEKKES
jgi:preprotein translocase subunit YajC